MIEERCGHLATTGVLHADEEHFGYFFHELSLRLSDGHEALTAKTVREDGNVVVEAHFTERVDGLPRDPLDRLAGDDAVELGGKVVHLLAEMCLRGRVEVRHREGTYRAPGVPRVAVWWRSGEGAVTR
jgi:hypothetical protein